jgi:hypothetical protein
VAGGIDWFRWHHGAVTDPKFQLVARKAGASLPDVLAVWAFVLERASSATERGCFGAIDAEALDCLFGFPSTETRTADILRVFAERGLTTDGRISRWEERQPKREREDDKSTGRVQAHRDRKRQETPGNANPPQETPRGEERREEKKDSVPKGTGGEPPSDRETVFAEGVPLLTAAGVSEKNARSMLAGLCKKHGEFAVVEAIAATAHAHPGEPVSWLQALLNGPRKTENQARRHYDTAEETAKRLKADERNATGVPAEVRAFAQQIKRVA